MGLTIVIYENKEEIVARYGIKASQLVVDERTREFSPIDANIQLNTQFNSSYAEVDIGNTSQVEWLRNEVEQILGVDSFIITRILYSGSHSGDVISLNEFSKLQSEIDLLNKKELPEGVKRFIDSLIYLLNAAEAKKNPLVFV